MKTRFPLALSVLKFLTIMTFGTILAVIFAGFLVMIKFTSILMILYSYYAMLPYLLALLTLFTAATIGLTLVYLQSSEEAAEVNVLPGFLKPEE